MLFGAWTDPYRVNPGNPASLPYLEATSLEFGFFARYNEFTHNESSQAVWSGNLDYISLAFPLQSKINALLDQRESDWDLAMNASIRPYSIVGYDLELTQPVMGIDTIKTIYTGQGGLTEASWAGGVKYKDLSWGIQFGYIFGQIENNSQIDLIQEVAPYSTRSFNTLNINGFSWRTGLQYRLWLDPKDPESNNRRRRSFVFGIYGNSPSGFRTTSERLVERLNVSYSSGAEVARDTLIFDTDVKGKGTLPMIWGGGMVFQRGDQLQIGINGEFQQWSVFDLENKQDLGLAYENSFRLSAGGEWTPNSTAFRKYFQRVRYRFGAYFERDPRVINDENFSGYGLQLGAGFPVILPRQQISFLDLGLEFGRRGITSIQQDTYVRIRLAATLNDNSWFYQRKFD